MGCDIHAYKEKLVNGQWVTADEWVDECGDGEDVPFKNRYTGRNYDLFGLLSKGVRRDFSFSFEPRGIPFDSSQQVRKVSDGWGADGHGHSYLFLHELKAMQAHLVTLTVPISGIKDEEGLALLDASIASDEPTNWYLIYPYWQGGKGKRFEYQVPATFAVSVDPLIDLFDGVDGENHRLVFWFDN